MVGVGIIDVIEHLPIGVLQPRLDTNGPYGVGSHSLTSWSDSGSIKSVSDTFGVVVQIYGAIAPKLGRIPGFSDTSAVDLELYEFRIAQLAVLHQLFGGAWVPTQVEDVFYAPQLFRWVESLPGMVGLYVSPVWQVDLFFLLAL